jgi:hypothetical protein
MYFNNRKLSYGEYGADLLIFYTHHIKYWSVLRICMIVILCCQPRFCLNKKTDQSCVDDSVHSYHKVRLIIKNNL